MSMICPIHKTHFGRGFAGRGRRRCYDCERNQTMGNTFEIHAWLPYGEGKYGYMLQWTGEDEDEAFAELRRLKSTGQHPCLKLEWR